METNDGVKTSRREFLRAVGTATAGLALGILPHAASAADGLKIGIIGSGRIGSTLGGIWVKAGHEVMFSSLDLEQDKALAARLGGKARAGTTREAASSGCMDQEVACSKEVFSAVPRTLKSLVYCREG